MNLGQILELSFSPVSQKKHSTDQQTDMQRHTCISWIPNPSRSITKGFSLLASGYGWSVYLSTFFFSLRSRLKDIRPFDKVFCILPDNSSRQMYLWHRMKGIFGGGSYVKYDAKIVAKCQVLWYSFYKNLLVWNRCLQFQQVNQVRNG